MRDLTGVFYIATEPSFISEAAESAKSVKEHSSVSIALLTDGSLTDSCNFEHFDEIIKVENVYDDLRDKIYNMKKSPFDRTLYLDCDTLVVGDISPVFELLDRVDIAGAHATKRDRINTDHIPDAFPELNTAVLAYNSNEDILDLFERWEKIHSIRHCDKKESGEDLGRFGTAHGQPPFREALYSSDVDFAILPSEYNLQLTGRGYVYKHPKILHGVHRHKIARHLPLSESMVVFTKGNHKNILNKRERAIRIIDEEIIKSKFVRHSASKLGIKNELKQVYNIASRVFKN